MIEWIILIVFLAGAFFFYKFNSGRATCPYCKNRQEQSSLPEEKCNKCSRTWIYLYEEENG